jgi:hypothetical protein
MRTKGPRACKPVTEYDEPRPPAVDLEEYERADDD